MSQSRARTRTKELAHGPLNADPRFAIGAASVASTSNHFYHSQAWPFAVRSGRGGGARRIEGILSFLVAIEVADFCCTFWQSNG